MTWVLRRRSLPIATLSWAAMPTTDSGSCMTPRVPQAGIVGHERLGAAKRAAAAGSA